MKTNFKLKALAVAAIMAVSAPALATMQGATSGNGELIVNFVTQGGVSKTSGGDDYSAAFDLGVSMNDVLSWNGVAGFSRTWNLDTGVMTGTGIVGSSAIANYGTVWSDLNNSAIAAATTAANFQFNVIALDNTDKTTVIGGSRYLTTADVATFPALTAANLKGFDVMDQYVDKNNLLGTHASSANGASLATAADAPNSFFRLVNGAGEGDTWATKTTADTTKDLAIAQNFWFLTENGTASVKTAFGVDLNASGAIGAGEFGEWSINAANHTITYTNPGVAAPVPEASTWAMLLAGLGMISMMIRRRTNS